MAAKGKRPASVTYDKSRPRWRVSYYPSGYASIGKRKWEDFKTEEEARCRAEVIDHELGLAVGVVPHADLTLGEVAAEWVESLQGGEEGTIKAYRSDLNSYVLHPAVRLSVVPVSDLGIEHFCRVIDHVAGRGLSRSTLDNAVRTVKALTAWATLRGRMPSTAWGTREQRRLALKQARTKVEVNRSNQIGFDQVPTWGDIEAFAEQMESLYRRRGRNFVLIMAGSGLRVGEALGLRVTDIDIDTCTIRVRRQADRLAPWPATKLPKDKKERETYMWGHLRHVLVDAVANADEDGWLFPPHLEQFGSRGLWWVNRLTDITTRARRAAGWHDQGWDNKWCRHHYASYSLASRPWGWGIPIQVVSGALGHVKQSTTLDHYSQKTGDAAAIVAAATAS